MRAILSLLRPHQYIKNGFVLVGPLFGHQWDQTTLLDAGLAFVAFSAMASAVYVLNDIMDVEADREHPVKRHRPLPSGAVSITFARALMVALVMVSLAVGYEAGPWVAVFAACYFVLNIAYSWRLKHVVILDVFIISAGFMLRILAGTLGLGIEPSQWLLLCGLMVTLFLGFAKRRAELLMLETHGATPNLVRRVLDDYHPQMLEQYISVTATSTILCYGLYTLAPATVEMHGSTNLIYTLPFVTYGIFRYLYLLHKKDRGADTARDLITDAHLLLAVVGWVATTLWILW